MGYRAIQITEISAHYRERYFESLDMMQLPIKIMDLIGNPSGVKKACDNAKILPNMTGIDYASALQAFKTWRILTLKCTLHCRF